MKCGSKKRNVFVLFVSVSFNDISQFSNNNNNKKEGEPSIDPLSPLFFFFFAAIFFTLQVVSENYWKSSQSALGDPHVANAWLMPG